MKVEAAFLEAAQMAVNNREAPDNKDASIPDFIVRQQNKISLKATEERLLLITRRKPRQ